MRRTTKVGAAVASLALILAACGDDDDTATDASSAPPAAGSSTFTIWADEIRTPPIKEQCDAFAAANGITCDVVQMDFGDIRAASRPGQPDRATSRTSSSAPMTGSASWSPTAW